MIEKKLDSSDALRQHSSMRPFFWLKLLCAALALLPLNLCAQSTAKDVFKKAENSVFLVYLQDDKGEATALGTAFVVGPRLLISNAHVVESGNPVLAVGPIRVPLTVKKRDSLNDLALLSVDVDLPAALPLSVGAVQTGEQVFAIGNPEGLEKTISEGIVSGRRKSEGKDLLQITSPISHGSSGGPVLNSSSQVVGVAVAFLGSGQNLNFAVPAEYVTNLLSNKQAEAHSSIPAKDLLPTLRTAVSLRDADKYSSEDSSPYQAHSRSAIIAMAEAVHGVDDTASLRELTCIGTNSFDLSDLGIQAARKANRVPTRETEALLAFALYDRSSNAALTAAISKEGSNERETAEADRKRFSMEAESVASTVLSRSPKSKPNLLALHVLGGIKAEANDYNAVITDEIPIVAANMNVCSIDLRMVAYRRLINAYENLKKAPEAEQWFRRYAEVYSPEPYEWDKEGDRREEANDSASAASAYEKAALGADYLAYDYCYAATDRFKNADSNSDSVLDDGRKCIAAAAKNSDKTNQHYYDTGVPGLKCARG